jgi:hypothetical protein
MAIVARTPAEFRALGPGLYVALGIEQTFCWVTPEEPIADVQRRINRHKLDPAGVALDRADVATLAHWLLEHL